jgi:hypothetical protein
VGRLVDGERSWEAVDGDFGQIARGGPLASGERLTVDTVASRALAV